MQNIKLEDDYLIKEIFPEKTTIVEKICEKCSDCYLLHDGTLPSKKI